jgi:hypothetical protein
MRAKRLREQAVSDPRSLTDSIGEIKRYLDAGSTTEQRHVTEAARKIAYVAPRKMVPCKEPLARLAGDQTAETPARKSACFALGYIGRVDEEATELLAEPQRDPRDSAVREAAAKARNDIAREAGNDSEPDSVSPDTATNTKVFGTGTDGLTGETDVYQSSSNVQTAMNHCPDCGVRLADRDSPNFCSDCGADLSTQTYCPGCGSQVGRNDQYCTNCGSTLS